MTQAGSLSPLQAQLELALPTGRGLPDAVIRVDLAAMRKDGIKLDDFTRVSSRYGMPGGGTELRIHERIRPKYLTVTKR